MVANPGVRGIQVTLPSFLTSALDVVVLDITPRPLYLGKEPRYVLNVRLDVSDNTEVLPLPRFEPRTVHTVV
jgi:hypothetical protein